MTGSSTQVAAEQQKEPLTPPEHLPNKEKDDTPSPARIELFFRAAGLCWKVSYGPWGPPGWLGHLLDCFLQRRMREFGTEVPKFSRLGTLETLCKEVGIRPVARRYIEEALRQNAGVMIEAFLPPAEKQHWPWETVASFNRYGWYSVTDSTDEALSPRYLIEFRYSRWAVWGKAEARPLNGEYWAELPDSSQKLYEWLGYRLYAAHLRGCPTAAIRYSDFCFYASLPRQVTQDEIRSQLEPLHEPHFRSSYVEEVRYEPGPLTEGFPDWDLVYKAGPGAQTEFEQYRERRIQAILRDQDR